MKDNDIEFYLRYGAWRTVAVSLQGIVREGTDQSRLILSVL